MSDFYKDLDLKYPEIAITLEKFNKYSDATVLCSIPVLMPFMQNSADRIDTGNIENKINNLGIRPCIIHKGMYIKINREYSQYCPADEFGRVPAGQKFIVVFVGGDIDKPRVIGRY